MEPNKGNQFPVRVYGWVARLRALWAHARSPLWTTLTSSSEGGKRRSLTPSSNALTYICVIPRFLPPTNAMVWTWWPYLQRLAVVRSQGTVNETVIFLMISMQRALVLRKQQIVKSHCKYLWLGLFFIWTDLGLHTGAAPHRVNVYVSMPFSNCCCWGIFIASAFWIAWYNEHVWLQHV